jgi:hypothetical protein
MVQNPDRAYDPLVPTMTDRPPLTSDKAAKRAAPRWFVRVLWITL